jgi:hypothetical protein
MKFNGKANELVKSQMCQINNPRKKRVKIQAKEAAFLAPLLSLAVEKCTKNPRLSLSPLLLPTTLYMYKSKEGKILTLITNLSYKQPNRGHKSLRTGRMDQMQKRTALRGAHLYFFLRRLLLPCRSAVVVVAMLLLSSASPRFPALLSLASMGRRGAAAAPVLLPVPSLRARGGYCFGWLRVPYF